VRDHNILGLVKKTAGQRFLLAVPQNLTPVHFAQTPQMVMNWAVQNRQKAFPGFWTPQMKAF